MSIYGYICIKTHKCAAWFRGNMRTYVYADSVWKTHFDCDVQV